MKIGYARVSTKDQLDGYGLDVQQETLERMSVATIHFDTGVSGTDLERPGLGDAIARLQAGDELVVPRLDRLARDLIVQELLLAEIKRKGATVVSCAEGENAYLTDDSADPSRTLIRQILGAVAQYERAMIARRTQAGKRAKKAAGGYAGGQPPYGWRGEGGKLLEVPLEQYALSIMRNQQRLGWTFEAMAAQLNGLNSGRRNGKPWTAGAVRKILARQGAPAGAVGQDGGSVDPRQVDDQVAVLDGNGGKDVRADRGGPLGL